MSPVGPCRLESPNVLREDQLMRTAHNDELQDSVVNSVLGLETNLKIP